MTCGRSVVSPGIPVSSTNKTEILLKVELNTIVLNLSMSGPDSGGVGGYY